MSIPQQTKEYVLPKVATYRNLRIREAPIAKLKASEVLVKVHAVSLQYRDLTISNGSYDIGVYENIVPCSDMAGEVLAVGEDVQGQWTKGDRVCCNFAPAHLFGDITPASVNSSMGGQSPGVLTQYRCFPAEALVKIPEHLTYVQASTLPCAALTAYAALHGARPIKAGDTVLILGTGGVSIFGLQFAVATGATVIITSSSNEKLKTAAKLGAKHLINYKEKPDWEKEVLRITQGRGVDHVVEARCRLSLAMAPVHCVFQVGGPGTLSKSIMSVKHGGGVHVIGFLDTNAAKENPIVTIIMKAIAINGVYIGSVAQFKDMMRLIAANPKETEPVVDRVFQFDDVQGAYAYMESQKHLGKIVIQVA